MEKPAPMFDRFNRYTKTDSYDHGQGVQYNERMIARGIPVVSDKNESSDKPVWRGDHSFNSDAASYSLMHFIEPEVASQHPDWGIEKVKKEARNRFTRRLAQDLSYENRENDHEETVVQWHPITTSDGSVELATEYGDGMITLKELWKHTKEYAVFVGKPEAYNQEEERVQLTMQDAFVRGSSTGFVSVISHPDAVRYVQVWEKAPDGEITSKQVDLFSTTGRDFSKEESERLIEHLAVFDGHTSIDVRLPDSSYTHVFVERGAVKEQNIRMIATALVMQHEYHAEAGLSESVIHMRDARPKVREAADSMVLLGRFLHDHISETLDRLKNIDSKKAPKDAVPIHPASRRPLEHRIKRGQISAAESILHVISRSEQSPKRRIERGEKPVHAAMAEWFISQTIVTNSRDLPAGPHAALYWFSLLEERESLQSRAPSFVDKPTTETQVATSPNVSPLKHIWETVFFGLRQILAPGRNGETILTKKKDSVTKKIKPSGNEASRRLIRAPELLQVFFRGVRDRFQKFIHVPLYVREAARVIGVPNQNTELPFVPKENRELPAVYVKSLEVAWVVWYMLRADRTSSGKDVPARNSVGKIPLLVRREVRATDHHEEETMWVLLGIIRYLTLLRESGRGGHIQGVRAKRNKARQALGFRTISRARAIIFTIAS